MTNSIFINLPVANLAASISFYQALGFSKNEQFTDETAAGMVWSDPIYVMLLTHQKWRQFTQRPIPAHDSSEVMLALSLANKEAVDLMTEASKAAGGTADINPIQDLGFMYGRAFADLDGHIWEPFWMDMAATPSAED